MVNGYDIHADTYANYQTALEKQNQIQEQLGYDTKIETLLTAIGKLYRITLIHTAKTRAEKEEIIEQLKQSKLAVLPW